MMRGRAINENFLMSIASLGAMFLGDYSEAVGVMLFYRVGEYLQERAVGSSRRSVSELMSLRPEAVHVKKAGAVDDVPPSEVLPGSLIEVRPGERVPLDGVVTGGFSVLDTSAMTGESPAGGSRIRKPRAGGVHQRAGCAGSAYGAGLAAFRPGAGPGTGGSRIRPQIPLWRGGCPHFPAFIRRW